MPRRFYVFRMIALVVLSSVAVSAQGASEVPAISCDCEPIACAPCEVEKGISFYSAKCGPGFERVKSCKKPQCAAVENQRQCLALLGEKPSEPVAVREPASRKEAVRAGLIEQVEGAALVIRASGPTEAPRAQLELWNGDVIETKTNGKVRARLNDGSEITIAANSRLVIENVQVNEEKGSRKVALNLILGKVRSRVTKKYEGDNAFLVKTKTAVAGVRGTDFVATYEPGETEWISAVHTIEGSVHFDRSHAGVVDRGVDVPVGTYASLTVGPPSRNDSEEEFFKAIESGKMSPVFKVKDEELEALKSATEFAANAAPPSTRTAPRPARGAANADADPSSVCGSPAGQFNQCSFTCEGAGRGAKSCRTDLKGVACVRRLCSANGQWTEPSRLPASGAQRCQPGHVVVGDCGGYW